MTKKSTIENTSLPAGWEIKKLGEVSETIMGQAPPGKECNREGLGYPFVKTGQFGEIYPKINEWTTKPLKKVCEGDVLITVVGATIGKLNLGVSCAIGRSVAGIRVKEGVVDHLFLYNYLFLWVEKLRKISTGAAITVISKKTIFDIPFPLPPLPQQKQIVAILDKAFAAIDTAKVNAEQNLQNAKELFESYLQNVFENKGGDWVTSTIGESCNLMTGGTPSRSKKEYFDNGTINWLVSGDINKKEINDCEGKITELGFENSNTKFLPLNSVMIALNGQGKTRGTVAMLRIKATCNQSLVSIYPKDDSSLLPELIYANLEGRYNEIRKITGDSGNDRRGLNMPLIRKISFSYPTSIDEQKVIIGQLASLKSQTNKLEAIYTQKLADLEEMKKSILQKAFSGQLNTIN